MKRMGFALFGLILAASSGSLRAHPPESFRVLFGINDSANTRWDGTLQVKQAGPYSLEPWRFDANDYISPDGSTFHLSTRYWSDLTALRVGSVVANGFVITAQAVTESSDFILTTAQGDFSFSAAEVPFAKGIYKLGGRVYIDRIPSAVRLTDTPEEEDYPSLAAAANGDAWLAYVQFHHSPDADKLRANLTQFPKDFRQYAEPTGGDQIWARKYSGGSWGEPIAVTPAGRDCYKTAVAVDGKGRAWVFWADNHEGNFDIFARAVEPEGTGEQVQISEEEGADIDPVATTDASGRVWVAWQGWRNGVAAIYAAHQEGSGFSPPVKISNTNKNEWDPAIAADRTGRVAVAWDSYRNGNYDVYARVWSAPAWGGEIPVAATARYEAYPSIAYDPSGRLWIAYEEGGRGWGKDFGAYDTNGISLYQARLVKLRGLEPNGSFVALDASLDAALIGAPSEQVERLGSQEKEGTLDPELLKTVGTFQLFIGSQTDAGPIDPNPDAARHRAPDESFQRFEGVPRNNLPRLVIDGSGRIWLVFRTRHPVWRNEFGYVWTEYLVSFDGHKWTRPIFLNHTDNILDNRPALAALANGRLLVVNSSDGRRDVSPAMLAKTKGNHDPYNNDLWSDEVDLGPATRALPVLATTHETKPAMTWDPASTSAIQAMRDYRGGPEKNLRIVRGEFHRHSEISHDGRNDGTLFDQWRYIRDAAALDWVGCCDHDNGNGREYSWWIIQKLTDVFYAPGNFAPMFSYERSLNYPDGHRNVIFVQRGIHPLPRLNPGRLGTGAEESRFEHTPDTQMLYAYLKQFDGIVGSHTSATVQGTDWRDNDPDVEPVVEIYQGLRQSYEMPDAPRTPTEKDAISGWRPKGFINLALAKGYRLGFEASSDHISTHISYSILYVKDVTRESIMQALKQRHVYGATDDILADVESGAHMMGDEFSTPDPPTLKIKLRGTSQFAKISIIRDGQYVYSSSPHTQEVEFSWRDAQPNRGQVSYYYVRGEQDNGEIVWVSPMWIKYTGN